jgi:phosphonate transport system ATP-binding protein
VSTDARACSDPAIRLTSVSVVYPNGITALRELSVEIASGELCVVVGLSGAGKSTLLRVIDGLVSVTSGRVAVYSDDVSRVRGRKLRELRAGVGMIFQDHRLVRRLTALQNVLVGRVAYVPVWRQLAGLWPKDDIEIAFDALERVGLADRAHTPCGQLSGGQQQRIGIARALAQRPRIILADEPVASLDPVTSRKIMDDLARIHADLGLTMLVNLHYLDLASRYAQRILGLREGRLVHDAPGDSVTREDYAAIYGRAVTDEDVLSGAPLSGAP